MSHIAHGLPTPVIVTETRTAQYLYNATIFDELRSQFMSGV